MTKVIYKGCFGSKLYGVSNSNSDTDIRQIHQSTFEEILFKKDQESICQKIAEIDFESKELKRFIYDCLSGQTYALDIIFTPRNLWYEVSDTWYEIQRYRNKLVTNDGSGFMSYCRGQAGKYSKRGDKLNELIKLRDILLKFNSKDPLRLVFDENDILDFEHICIERKFNSGSKTYETMLRTVESYYPFDRKISDVLGSLNLKIDSFGDRSKKASQNKGIDLKAYYHAFRVAWEFEELLETGELKFPSKRKDLLINMRTGIYSKAFLDHWITEEINRIEAIPNNLPKPDQEFWDAWLLERYKKGN